MRIACVCGFVSYWGRQPPNVLDLEEGETVGGGEESALRCASGLAELGHDVHLWWYGAAGIWRGVEFNSLSDPLYTRLVGEHWDAVASWTALRPLMYCRPGTKRIWVNQLNDLAAPGDFTKCDVIVSPSSDHAKMVYGWGWRGKQAVVHNGLDIELYKKPKPTLLKGCTNWVDEVPWERREMNVGYWSSPDRGLHHLLRAWPLVKKAEPKAKLFVAYEIKRYLKIALKSRNAIFSGRAFDLQKLMHLCDDSVTFLGAVPRKKLAKYQKQCRVMCYPFDPICYTEGFGGAVNQGIAAGCLVMTTPKDAFPSLYGDSVYWLKKPTSDLDFHEYVAEQTVKALHGELPGQTEILAEAGRAADKYTWANAALQMEAVCRGENWMEGAP